jgi:hypothetical protein
MPDTAANDTPDPAALERSIRQRRRALVEHVHELERVVRAKLDVRTRLRRAGERGMLRATEIAERMVEQVRARPVPYLVMGGVLLVMLFRRRASFR